jgi:hypothetical protein
MDTGFITLFKKHETIDVLISNVQFDIMLVVVSALPGYYLSRTLFQIYRYEELSLLKYEWIPILLGGVTFISWVVESAYFDIMNYLSPETNGIRDATLFLSVSIFAIAMARFAETWGTYARGVEIKRKMLAQAELERGELPFERDELRVEARRKQAVG